MSRQYPGSYDDGSPLTPSAANPNTPISYSANVNRQKTKKWVEAKPADYGGGWGDDDDDDYEPETPPVPPKATGLRQPGQAVQPGSSGLSNDGAKKSYGDLPAVQTDSQPRSATTTGRNRTNSFGPDDERRAFSASATAPRTFDQMLPPPPSESQSVHPPALQVQTHPSVTGLRKPVQQSSPVNTQAPQPIARGEEPQSTTSSKYTDLSKQSEMRSPASESQRRRDFSPSAISQPARYSPAIQSATSDAPSTRFPPRKSSINSNPPDLADITRTSQEVQKPWVAPRSASPSGSARSPTSDKKALPFIRPADIYKRMEEERERERQSMDSSRPSMDSILGPKAGDRSDSPARGNYQGLRSESPGYSMEHGSDSGRRPVLEPVRERKSEYGLEGFVPPSDPAAPEATAAPPQISQTEPQQYDEESEDERRRFSTSPKLPDLGRMSGFGMDMFSQPKRDNQPTPGLVTTFAPETLVSATSAPGPSDADLHPRPSLGFTSVVNQAFDAENNTPASAPESGVRRTDSESTGTTGISPIMSRLGSTAAGRDVDEHQASTTPAIEEVEEPQSSRTSSHALPAVSDRQPLTDDISDDEELPPAIRPGHRRNISTPSPGNSPAKTPFVEVGPNRRYHPGEEAHISEATQPSLTPINTLSQDSRPQAEREQSFRPALPGAWTSYNTTASDNIAAREAEAQAADAAVSPISEDEDEVEITPTTATRPLPQSELGAVAGYALAGLGRREGSQPPTPIEPSGIKTFTPMIQSNSQLPTPDPALAPIGNPYSAPALDPRLQQSSSHLGVPQQGSGDVSSASSAPPTPPPKDTPNPDAQSSSAEYFPPHVPLKPKTQDEVAATEALAPPTRPQVLPTLSTATSPQDEESDKLRKEIVKSLSPRPSDAGTGQSLGLPEVSEDAVAGTRESTYLPSEYDNYWASTDEQEVVQHPAREMSGASRPEQSQPSLQFSEASPDADAPPPPIPPLSSKRQSAEHQRSDIGNRFSWEAGSEQVISPVPAPLNISRPGTGQGTTPDSQLRPLEQTREAYFEHGPVDSPAHTPAQTPGQPPPFTKTTEAPALTSPIGQQGYDSISEPSSASDHGKDAALMAGGLAAGAAAGAAYVSHQGNSNEHQRRLSLAEEKDPVNASTYAVTQTPPEDEHPARSPQVLVSPVSQGSGSPFVHTVEPATAPTPIGYAGAGAAKIMQFKEILAIQNPQHRVKAYNDTRDQFLNMDTGLSGWLASIGEQHRQLGEPLNIGGPVRPNVLKAAGSSPSSPALQQPYYQQYLNASPTTSRPPTAGHGAGFPSGTQQGFAPSPGASKLSSQQVGAKSKELLHTAGIFGGKASKAGKGLFAKGKNKLRGSGGGDKDSPPLKPSPPPAKPKLKDGRRSSWGISSLTLPRSSARNDASSQHSREETPTRAPPQSRTPSFPLQLTTSQTPTPSVNQREISLWDAPVSAVSTPSVRHSVPATAPQPLNNTSLHPQGHPLSGYANSNGDVSRDGDEEEEERDGLGVPAPIGKNQPSWDPFNATPIVEEEGFQYEDRAKPNSTIVAAPQLGVPGQDRPLDATSDRSDSGETAYLSARERHSEATERPSDDWILVSKDETAQAPVETLPHAVAILPTIASGVDIDDVSSPGRDAAPPTTMSPSAATSAATTAAREATVQVQEIETPSGEFPPSRGPAVQERITPPAAVQSQHREEVYAPPPGPPPQQTRTQPREHVEEYAPPPGPPPQHMAARQSNVPAPISQNQTALPAQSSPKPLYDQSLQDRYANSAAFSPPRTFNPEPPVSSQPVRQQQVYPPQYNPAPPSGNQQRSPAPEGSSKPGFVGLPPIRRSSTFGLGFGKDKKRFPIDDEEDVPPMPNGVRTGSMPQQGPVSQAPVGNNRYSWTEEDRPAVIHQSSSNYDQSIAGSDVNTLPGKEPPSQQGQYVPPARQSQDGWRPQVAPNQRPSLEAQRMRSGSSSSQGYMITPGTAGVPLRPVSYQKPFEQPPSSAQRYPDLFRPEQLGEKPSLQESKVDLPAHHYQAPISREEAFMPRHSTNEYQLPGVGPPPEEPPNGRASRRNSALFKELGGRLSRELSRATSRDRGANRDRDLNDDEDDDLPLPGRILISRDTGISEPSIASFDTAGEKKKRRSSFFGALSRASTSGTPVPPQSRESMVAHAPGSRTDLLAGVPAQPSPLGPPDKKRSFFGGSTSKPTLEPKAGTPHKLTRASTSGFSPSPSEQSGKKKRFSGLSSIFSSSGRPGAEQEKRRPGSSTPAMQGPQNVQGGPYQQQQQQQQRPSGPFAPAGQPAPAWRGPPGGPALEGRQILQAQIPMGAQYPQGQVPQNGPYRQGQPLQGQGSQDGQFRQGQPPQGQGPQDRQYRQGQPPQGGQYPPGQSPQGPIVPDQAPQLGQIPPQTPFQFTQDPTNLMRQGPPPPLPAAGPPPVQSPQPREPEKKSGGAPPLFQPMPQQPQIVRQNTNRDQVLTPGQQSLSSIQPVPSSQNITRQSPPSQLLQSPVPATGSPGVQSPYQQGPPPGFQQQQSQLSQPLGQGPQGPQIYQRQSSVGSAGQFPQGSVPGQGQQPPYVPKSYGPNPDQNAPDYPRQNHGGQPSLPLAEQSARQVGPAAQPMGGPRRSDSAQRKLTRASPTQKEKPKEKNSGSESGGNRSSASRLFGGLLGKGNSSDKANKNIPEQQRSVAAPGPQQQGLQQQGPQQQGPQQQGPQQQGPQQWPGQQPQSALHQPRPLPPHQAPRQVSQQSVLAGPQYRYPPQQVPQGYQDPKHPQDRGRQLQREPQYEQPPIPGAYSLVRGEGAMLAPTNYDPRGMNRQYSGPPPNDPRMMYQNGPQQYPPQVRHPSMQQQPGYSPPTQQASQQFQGHAPPQYITQHPNLSSQHQNSSQSPPGDRPTPGRPLSTEDLLARSPARPQFGQQAPYQLTLPEPEGGADAEDEVLTPAPRKGSLPPLVNHQTSPAVLPNSEREKTPTASPPKNFAPAGPINTKTVQNLSQPSLRHPLSPATYPLPQDSVFSPINPSAQEIPPPPPPKNWPPKQSQNTQTRAKTPDTDAQGLDRSNTINTHASEISQLSAPRNGSLSVPTVQETQRGVTESNTPPSPQITPQAMPERSPETVQTRQMASQKEDIYNASPPQSRAAARPPSVPKIDIDTSVGGSGGHVSRAIAPVGASVAGGAENARPSSSSHEKQVLAESPDQRARRRAEQEEKILVEEGGLHPATGLGGGLSVEEEEAAMMSATSYPGQEWNPYGSGVFEDWND